MEPTRIPVEEMHPGDLIVNRSNGKTTRVVALEPHGTWHFKMTLDNGMPATFASRGTAYHVIRAQS